MTNIAQALSMCRLEDWNIMDQLNHYDYYVARAQSARHAANHAASPAIAAIHAEMAERYEGILVHFATETARPIERLQLAR